METNNTLCFFHDVIVIQYLLRAMFSVAQNRNVEFDRKQGFCIHERYLRPYAHMHLCISP